MAVRGITRAHARTVSWSLNLGRPTLVDRFFERGLASDAYLILGAAAFTALLAQVEVPLWPVPSTGQTLGVLLAGATLGAIRGALAMVLYLVLAALSVPVLAGGAHGLEHLTGPTAGYLYAFVAAAALVGWAVQRTWKRALVSVVGWLLAGSILILAAGVAWLAGSGSALPGAVHAGALVLIPGTVLKVIIAATVIVVGWRIVELDEARRAKDDLARQ